MSDLPRGRLLGRIVWSVVLTVVLAAAVRADSGPQRRTVLRAAQSRVVKLFGSGGLSGLESYQTGLLISAEGHVLTVNTSVLDTGEATVVTIDGARRAGSVIAADPVADLAVLKIDPAGERLPCWELSVESPPAELGEPIWVLANVFGIATGREPVTLLQGAVAARAPLTTLGPATPEESLVLDTVTSNPGAAGGAVIDLRGRLLGMIGREKRANATGAWVSHALPIERLAARVTDLLSRGSREPGELPKTAPVDFLATWGFALAPSVGPRTPPYVDYVLPGGSAEAAGLRPDDLIVLWNSRVTATRREVERLAGLGIAAQATVVVERTGSLLEVTLGAANAGPRPRAAPAEPPNP